MAMSTEEIPGTQESATAQRVTFNYKKGPECPTFHADGFFGGLTPKGHLYIDIFVERGPTPKRAEYQVDDTGTKLTEVSREGLEGVVRHVQCGIIMDMAAAKQLHTWIGAKLSEFKAVFLKESDNAET